MSDVYTSYAAMTKYGEFGPEAPALSLTDFLAGYAFFTFDLSSDVKPADDVSELNIDLTFLAATQDDMYVVAVAFYDTAFIQCTGPDMRMSRHLA